MTRSVVVASIVSIALLLLPSASVRAQCELDHVAASDSSIGLRFGVSVAADGGFGIVGASSAGQPANPGAVYIFHRKGADWLEDAILRPSDGAAGDLFGFSVGISGPYAIIGAPNAADPNTDVLTGAIYLMHRDDTGWHEIAKRSPADGQESDSFGFSVAIDGDIAVVGASLDDDLGISSGSAYVFRRIGSMWVEETKLTASDGEGLDQFGFAVDVDGDLIVVGAVLADGAAGDSGAAYVFRRNGTAWIEESKLTASDGAGSDSLGSAVSIDGNTVIVGARSDDDHGANSGSAYVFVRIEAPKGVFQWSQQAKLTASDGSANDLYGISVANRGDIAVIGATVADGVLNNSGAAYLYERVGTSWLFRNKLMAADGLTSDQFGRSVAIEGAYAFLGAALDDTTVADSGSMYVFGVGGDCNANGTPDGCEIATGAVLDCDGNGLPDGCDLAAAPELDCNNNSIPDSCDVASGQSADCNDNGTPDGCDIANGTVPDFNENGVPDFCDPNCNGNLFPDFLDILFFFSEDCNANTVPDECDLDSGVSVDCNDSGVPDDCEITGGAAPDCNGNMLIDGCEIAGGSVTDCDANGVPDDCQPDGDGDDVIDTCDGCPNDALKTEPGLCGCGISDTLDADNDDVIDCFDECLGTAAGEPIDESGCPTAGACCFVVGVCLNHIQPGVCQTISGYFQGQGTACGAPCVFFGDSDADGDVDMMDFLTLQTCFTAGGAASQECAAFDFDGDGDVDLTDYAAFHSLLAGPE